LCLRKGRCENCEKGDFLAVDFREWRLQRPTEGEEDREEEALKPSPLAPKMGSSRR
jgi:hypothetical protein